MWVIFRNLLSLPRRAISLSSMIWTHRTPITKPLVDSIILEAPGAMDCCITVLLISKEFGLPGLRVMLIASNSDVINIIRVHNSTFAVMIPDVCQLAAQAALEGFCKGYRKGHINAHVAAVLQKARVETWAGQKRRYTSLRWVQLFGLHTARYSITWLFSRGRVARLLHHQPREGEAFNF